MHLEPAIQDLWLGGIALEALLTVVFLGKRRWQDYPFFFGYVCLCLLGTIAAYSTRQHEVLYFYIYWGCEAIGVFLGLGVVREIFVNIFAPHAALRKLAKITFRIAVAVLVALAGLVLYSRSGDAVGIYKSILLAEVGARIVEVGLIMFLFLASSAFGLHWRHNIFGIALGLGMFASVELVTVTLSTRVNAPIREVFSLIRGLAFDFSLLVWLGYLLIPERVTSNLEMPKPAQLEQWNQAVMELISR